MKLKVQIAVPPQPRLQMRRPRTTAAYAFSPSVRGRSHHLQPPDWSSSIGKFLWGRGSDPGSRWCPITKPLHLSMAVKRLLQVPWCDRQSTHETRPYGRVSCVLSTACLLRVIEAIAVSITDAQRRLLVVRDHERCHGERARVRAEAAGVRRRRRRGKRHANFYSDGRLAQSRRTRRNSQAGEPAYVTT